MRLHRRALLAGTAAALCFRSASAVTIQGALPWQPNPGEPPPQVKPGPWQFFTGEEGAAIEALMDRLIPPDPQWAGAKDAGCAVYLDRQLAGPYGRSEGLYMRPPFADGLPTQGPQSAFTPAMRYRASLAALADHVRQGFAGKKIHELPPETLDQILTGLESGQLALADGSGKGFFALLQKNTIEGFFADPCYGGNRDMVGWRMIGFPGAHYDYSDRVERHNERYPLPPTGIYGGPEWASAEKG